LNYTLISVSELAKYLNVSIPFAYQVVKRTDFPSVKLGENRWLVIKEEVDNWLKAEAKKVKVLWEWLNRKDG